MKRFSILFLTFVMVFSICGCTQDSGNSFTFYYLRSEESISYGTQDALIAPVDREISDQGVPLNYLLRMYLSSPLPENFRSPFPSGTRLHSVSEENGTLTVVLSEEFSALEDIQLSLACACLCATCFELTEAQSIQIQSGGESFAFDQNSFTLLDEIIPTE